MYQPYSDVEAYKLYRKHSPTSIIADGEIGKCILTLLLEKDLEGVSCRIPGLWEQVSSTEHKCQLTKSYDILESVGGESNCTLQLKSGDIQVPLQPDEVLCFPFCSMQSKVWLHATHAAGLQLQDMPTLRVALESFDKRRQTVLQTVKWKHYKIVAGELQLPVTSYWSALATLLFRQGSAS